MTASSIASRARPVAARVIPHARATRRAASWEHLRLTMALLSLVPLLWLAWLVIHGLPLPIADVGPAALATTLFCLGASAMVLLVQRLPLLSFPSLFLGVTFLFTCSPLILYRLEGAAAFGAWEFVDVPSILRAMPVIMLAFTSFLLGALLLPAGRLTRARPHPEGAVAEAVGPTPRERALRNVGLGIYGVSAGLVALSSFAGGTLSFAFEGGYSAYHGAKRAGQIANVVGVSVAHLLPWSLLILVATSRDRRARRLAVLLAVPFILIMLSVGDRGGPLATMGVITAGLYLVGARIGLWRSLAVIAVIAFLIPTILNLRQLPISQWSGAAIENAATNRVQATNTYGSGPLRGFLVSMSSPYQTLMATVKTVPEHEPFHLGSDYLSSLVVAIPFRSILFPFLGAEFHRLPPSQWVLLILHPGRNAGPGYLQVAEAYLQFGAAGVVGLYLIFGWALTRLWRSMGSRARDPLALAFTLIVMMETLLWVRNSSTLVVRAVAWGFVIVYVVPTLLARGRGSVRSRRRAAARAPAS